MIASSRVKLAGSIQGQLFHKLLSEWAGNELECKKKISKKSKPVSFLSCLVTFDPIIAKMKESCAWRINCVIYSEKWRRNFHHFHKNNQIVKQGIIAVNCNQAAICTKPSRFNLSFKDCVTDRDLKRHPGRRGNLSVTSTQKVTQKMRRRELCLNCRVGAFQPSCRNNSFPRIGSLTFKVTNWTIG